MYAHVHSLPLFYCYPLTISFHTHTHTQLQLLRQEQVRLQEEVAEKNKLVRFQQLKIVDMRKALNRELVSLSPAPSQQYNCKPSLSLSVCPFPRTLNLSACGRQSTVAMPSVWLPRDTQSLWASHSYTCQYMVQISGGDKSIDLHTNSLSHMTYLCRLRPLVLRKLGHRERMCGIATVWDTRCSTCVMHNNNYTGAPSYLCSADEGQQARNSCPELSLVVSRHRGAIFSVKYQYKEVVIHATPEHHIFFLLASHGLIPSCNWHFSSQRSQSSVDQFTPPPRLPHTFPAPPSVPFTMTTMLLRGKSPGPAPSGPITSCDDVNIQYLKHVIIKFLCSREDEVL